MIDTLPMPIPDRCCHHRPLNHSRRTPTLNRTLVRLISTTLPTYHPPSSLLTMRTSLSLASPQRFPRELREATGCRVRLFCDGRLAFQGRDIE
ncbi:hypothetical protein LZ554_004816 [Drepanopeziza brunnea f. sp. 'monogermtubi']|nr:hypothetical protein LZ554_004816 [Drepanopeziza brunnea f. sp. 'monogermtubi']